MPLLHFIVFFLIMGLKNGTTNESFGARKLLQAVAEPDTSISLRAQNFVAYTMLHLHVGKPYLIPKNIAEAKYIDSIGHGAGIDTKYLIPALVSSGLMGLMKAKNSDVSQLVLKKISFDTFKSSFPELDVSSMVTKTWNKITSHIIVRGKVNPICMSANGSVEISDDAIYLPRSMFGLQKWLLISELTFNKRL